MCRQGHFCPPSWRLFLAMVFEPHICVGLLLVIHLKKYQFYGDFVDLIVLFATKSMLSMTIQLLLNFFFHRQ